MGYHKNNRYDKTCGKFEFILRPSKFNLRSSSRIKVSEWKVPFRRPCLLLLRLGATVERERDWVRLQWGSGITSMLRIRSEKLMLSNANEKLHSKPTSSVSVSVILNPLNRTIRAARTNKWGFSICREVTNKLTQTHFSFRLYFVYFLRKQGYIDIYWVVLVTAKIDLYWEWYI